MSKYIITKEQTDAFASKTNQASGYSKKLEIFQPVDIELIVALSEIDPGYEKFADENLQPGERLQMTMNPAGEISIGYFNERGSGTEYMQITDVARFKENVHFKFL